MKFNSKRATTLACAVIMASSSMSLSTAAIGDQTLPIAANSAITTLVSLDSSFSTKKVTVKSSYTSTTNAIRLNWNKVSGASGYRIYKYNSSTKKWVKVKTIKSGSTTTARITGLSAGTKYKFKVKAYKKSSGKTTWGKASSIKYAATKPKQVTMKASSASKTAIRLNWNKVKCDGYKIYQKVNGKYKLIATIRNSSTTTYKVTGLYSASKYTFKVRPYKKDSAGKVVYGKAGVKTKTTKSAVVREANYSLYKLSSDTKAYNSTTYKSAGITIRSDYYTGYYDSNHPNYVTLVVNRSYYAVKKSAVSKVSGVTKILPTGAISSADEGVTHESPCFTTCCAMFLRYEYGLNVTKEQVHTKAQKLGFVDNAENGSMGIQYVDAVTLCNTMLKENNKSQTVELGLYSEYITYSEAKTYIETKLNSNHRVLISVKHSGSYVNNREVHQYHTDGSGNWHEIIIVGYGGGYYYVIDPAYAESPAQDYYYYGIQKVSSKTIINSFLSGKGYLISAA